MLKIAIAVPCYDKIEPAFFQSMMSAVTYFYETRLEDEDGNPLPRKVQVFVASGIIQEARHKLFKEALAWDADYILWADCDHIFPDDTIPRLLSHQLDIVGCNYARRVPYNQPTMPVAAKLGRDDYPEGEKLCYTTPEKAEANELERVDHMGLGLTLMRMSILERLILQAEADGAASFMPLFHWEDKGDGGGSIGEDVYFFAKCRKAGIDVWCDHGLSWEVGHISKTILTHAHVQRDIKRLNGG